MVMLLMALCIAMFGVAVSALAFGAATRGNENQVAAPAEEALSVEPSRFFVEHVPATAAPPMPRVPIEVLLAQIERHVRLEHAAAESFIDFPTAESLHCRTMSPLVH
jgi:hypothetical protein